MEYSINISSTTGDITQHLGRKLHVSWKIWHAIAWLILSIVTSIYTVSGLPTPRPLYLFVGIGVTLLIFSLPLWKNKSQYSHQEIASFLTGILMCNWVLKYTLRARVPLVGSDQYAHYVGRTAPIVENGFVSTQLGMYSDTPLLHVWLAINAIISNLWVYDLRFVALLSSSLLPLLFLILGKEVNGLETGLFSALVTVSFPIFMRTGALFDSESIVIPWYIILLFFTLRADYESQAFYQISIVVLIIGSAFIHFLYSLVVASIITGTVLIAFFVGLIGYSPSQNVRRIVAPIMGTTIAALFVGYRIISLSSGASKFLGLGVEGSSFSMPNNPITLLFPSSGRVGQMATTGSGGEIDILLNNTPLIVYVLFAAIGGVYTIAHSRNKSKLFLLLIATLVSTAITIVGLVGYSSGEAWQLGFRFYYFSGAIGIIHVGIGLHWLSKVSKFSLSKRLSIWGFIKVATIILLVLYLTIAPMTTYGNNVDSPFSNLSTAIDKTERAQFHSLDRFLGDGEADIDFRVQDLNNPSEDTLQIFGPDIENSRQDSLYITSTRVGCRGSSQIWDSNQYSLCEIRA